MKYLIPFLLLSSCSTLLTGGMAAGGAAIGSLVGPLGAAGGAAAGVDGLIWQISHFMQPAGWWYLILFVLVPLFTKRGRGWVTSFLNSASKKQVLAQDGRLNTLEELISSITKKGKKK